jgi:hypothetical protein
LRTSDGCILSISHDALNAAKMKGSSHIDVTAQPSFGGKAHLSLELRHD